MAVEGRGAGGGGGGSGGLGIGVLATFPCLTIRKGASAVQQARKDDQELAGTPCDWHRADVADGIKCPDSEDKESHRESHRGRQHSSFLRRARQRAVHQ